MRNTNEGLAARFRQKEEEKQREVGEAELRARALEESVVSLRSQLASLPEESPRRGILEQAKRTAEEAYEAHVLENEAELFARVQRLEARRRPLPQQAEGEEDIGLAA